MVCSFRKLKEQRLREEKEQQETLLQLQNGQVSVSPGEEEESPEQIMGLDLSTWEDRSYEQREKSLQDLIAYRGEGKTEEMAEDESSRMKAETEASNSVLTPAGVERERPRAADEQSHKTTRAKRENRRLRELEQAKFSLDLLKVRANSGGASSPSEEQRWSLELVPPASPPVQSPQGTPDSQSSKGSFELLSMDEEPLKATEEVTDSEDPFSPVRPVSSASDFNEEAGPWSPKPTGPHKTSSDGVHPEHSQSPTKPDLSAPSCSSKIEHNLPTFYVPAREGITSVSHHRHHHTTTEEPQRNKETAVSTTASDNAKPLRQRREPSRRPVVVVISMQKETPLSEELKRILPTSLHFPDSAAQTSDVASSVPAPGSVSHGPASRPDPSVIEKLVQLNEEKEERQRNQQQRNEKAMMEQIRQQKEALEQQRLIFAQFEKDMFEKQKGEAMLRIKQSREGGQVIARASSSIKSPRPSSLLIEKTSQQASHSRTQSDSTPPSLHSPPGDDSHGSARYTQLPPPPSSAPTERRKDSRPAAEGWAPKLTLESRGGSRIKTAGEKTQNQQDATVSATEKPRTFFFSPNDRLTS